MGSLRLVNCLVYQFNHSQARYPSVFTCLSSVCAYNVKDNSTKFEGKLVFLDHFLEKFKFGTINFILFQSCVILRYKYSALIG